MKNMHSILIVEDENDLAEVLVRYLQMDGYQTERAKDGPEGLTLWRATQPDLILLDIMLPRLSGLEVLRTIRESRKRTAVIMLTARAEEIDHVLGLELGADDYVVKPFRPRELLARIKAVLRRTRQPDETDDRPLRVGNLELDVVRFSARLSGKKLEVTPAEFRLLSILARSPGRVFSRQELIAEALPESEAMDRVVDAHMMHLRQKMVRLDPTPLLVTVRGVGYKLGEGP